MKAVGAMLALVILLSGCIRYEGTIRIGPDGAGDVSVLVAIDPEAFEIFGELSELGGTEEICQQFDNEIALEEDFPAGATVEPYNEDGLCGGRVTYDLAASNDHSVALADAFDDTIRLYSDGENWFFETSFSGEQITGEAEEFGGDAIVEELFGDASFRINVDLPGQAVPGQNNATEVGRNGQFSWDIDLLNPPARLFAETEPAPEVPVDESSSTGGASDDASSTDGAASEEVAGAANTEAPDDDGGGGISPLLIGLIVAALIALGALVWFLKKRNDADAASTGDFVDPGAMPRPAGAFGTQSAVTPNGMPISGATATLPQDGPPLSDRVMHPPVMPTPSAADAVKETVMINPAAAQADTYAAPSLDPMYDETIGAWVVDDPTRGRLRHDPTTDAWIPL